MAYAKVSHPPTYTGITDLISYAQGMLNYEVAHRVEADPSGTLMLVIGLILGLFFLKNIFNYFALFFISFLRSGVLRDLRNALYKKMLSLPLNYFSEKGFLLGHASFVCIPKSFSAVEYAKHLFAFTAHESCGKCFPCRLGSTRGKEMLESALEDDIKFSEELIHDLLQKPIIDLLSYVGSFSSIYRYLK